MIAPAPRWGWVLGLLLALAPGAQAGTECRARAVTVDGFMQADRIARQVSDVLEREVRQAAVLARVGGDLSRFGLRYSHAAFVTRERAGEPWRVLHLLNECGGATSGIYREGLINFFLDGPFEYAALILVPGDATQASLTRVLGSRQPLELHDRRYDMLAHPHSADAQNSNQWVAEMMAATGSGNLSGMDRVQAVAWLAGRGFEGDLIRLTLMERLGAQLFAANVAFTGQPASDLANGDVRVSTVRSLARYLLQDDPDTRRFEVALSPASPRLVPVRTDPVVGRTSGLD